MYHACFNRLVRSRLAPRQSAEGVDKPVCQSCCEKMLRLAYEEQRILLHATRIGLLDFVIVLQPLTGDERGSIGCAMMSMDWIGVRMH